MVSCDYLNAPIYSFRAALQINWIGCNSFETVSNQIYSLKLINQFISNFRLIHQTHFLYSRIIIFLESCVQLDANIFNHHYFK